ncbi:MAG TPA: hypothetical protein VM934_10555 [Pyrinomonadaceae bacterium]|nr:hypothetical protein [Pyrinomonadaceae bacterium]
MLNSKPPKKISPARLTILLIVAALAFATAGCGRFAKSKVTVPPRLTPLVEAEIPQLITEINRLSAVRSLQGKIDIQFLDTSFADCGIVEKYRTAEGNFIVQRPGQIYLAVNAPFGVKIAEMSSDSQRFWVALYQGDEKYRRFVRGTNNAVYPKLDTNGAQPDCGGGDGKKKMEMQRAAVSSISSLRPQHFTDAILVRPVSLENSKLVYAQSEAFEEEPDTRKGAKSGARVVRGYYLLVELEPGEANRARVLRRFWFDRVSELRLARIQTYNERGQLMTDVTYSQPQSFGEEGRYKLPAIVELTRPQDGYSLRIGFQSPDAAKIDQQWPDESFVLQNSSNLPEYDLDARKE